MKALSTLTLASVGLISSATASAAKDWFVDRWCDLGGIFNFKDFACGVSPTPDTYYIPSTQRTNNTAGYALSGQVNKNSTDSSVPYINVKLSLTTPKPLTGQVFEMSMSFYKNATAYYDTAMCVVTYSGDA